MFEEIGSPEILIAEKPLSLRELEKRYIILKVLQETGWNKKKASEILGIDQERRCVGFYNTL